MTASAQSKNLEPEYIGQVVVVNADSTTTLLQSERATLKTGSSKWGYIPIPGSSMLDKAKSYITIKGAESKMTLPKGRLTFIVKCENNDVEPKNMIGILQFEVKKNKRQYKEGEFSVLGGMSSTISYSNVPFKAEKYGEKSYMVVIENAEPGQYGFMAAFTEYLTFGVK
jgi:hypothetical protein